MASVMLCPCHYINPRRLSLVGRFVQHEGPLISRIRMPGAQPSRLSPHYLQADFDLPTPSSVSGNSSRQSRAFTSKGKMYLFLYILLWASRLMRIRFHTVHLTDTVSIFCATQAESNGRYGGVGTQSLEG